LKLEPDLDPEPEKLSFLELETLSSLLSTDWSQERIRA